MDAEPLPTRNPHRVALLPIQNIYRFPAGELIERQDALPQRNPLRRPSIDLISFAT